MERVVVNLRTSEGEPGDPEDRYFAVPEGDTLDVRILDNGALRVAAGTAGNARTVTFAPGVWATCVAEEEPDV